MSSNASSPPARLAGKDLPRGAEPFTPGEWTDENTDGLHACRLAETAIRLTRGSRRGELVRLRQWQGDVICDALRVESGRRVYRTYELWVPRKNSKSLIGSVFAIDGLFDEQGAEVYSAAADKEQARIVFRDVKQSVEMSPDLAEILRVYKDAIEYPSTGSVYRVLSSEAFTKEGLNPSRVIFDELHAQPDDELWNVLNQGFGTREQPLLLAISTFGARTDNQGQDSLGYRQYQYCKRVLAGEVDDPTFGARIYETPADADHRDESVWHLANPALGDFLSIEDMRAQCRKQPEPDFRTKRLNIWVAGSNPWMPHGAWSACATPREVEPGAEIVLGFDGSYDGDSTALVGCTLDGHLFVVAAWEKPPGDDRWRVDIAAVEQTIIETAAQYAVREIACDPYRWQRSMQALEDRGLPIVEYPASSAARMVPACSTFYEAVMDGRLSHDGNPALARHIDNCVLKTTHPGPRIVKESKSSPRKIDLAVAAVIAYERALFYRGAGVQLIDLASL